MTVTATQPYSYLDTLMGASQPVSVASVASSTPDTTDASSTTPTDSVTLSPAVLSLLQGSGTTDATAELLGVPSSGSPLAGVYKILISGNAAGFYHTAYNAAHVKSDAAKTAVDPLDKVITAYQSATAASPGKTARTDFSA